MSTFNSISQLFGLISFIAIIWLAVGAFRNKRISWGLGILFGPIIPAVIYLVYFWNFGPSRYHLHLIGVMALITPATAIFYALKFWVDVKKPFLVYMTSFVLSAGAGIYVFSASGGWAMLGASQNVGGGIQDPEYLAVRNRIQPPGFRELPAEFRELGPSYRAAEPDGTRRWLEIEHGSRQNPGVEQRMRNHMTLALLETIRVPTLMIAGDADLLAPPSRMRLLAARVPGCQFATVPEAGHSAFWEQSEIWNRFVLEFLGNH